MQLPDEIVRQTNLIFNELALQYAEEGDYDRAIVLLDKVIASAKELALRFRAFHKLTSKLTKDTDSAPMTDELPPLQSPQFGAEAQIDHRYFLNRGDCYRAIGSSMVIQRVEMTMIDGRTT